MTSETAPLTTPVDVVDETVETAVSTIINPLEISRIAWEGVVRNKVRSLLTMLGVIIGVGAVIIMIAIIVSVITTIVVVSDATVIVIIVTSVDGTCGQATPCSSSTTMRRRLRCSRRRRATTSAARAWPLCTSTRRTASRHSSQAHHQPWMIGINRRRHHLHRSTPSSLPFTS